MDVRRNSGFTLLELLVVMFIVGIIAAMATLSVGVSSAGKGVEKELQRIEDLLRLASDDAVLQARELGLTFYSREYQFSAYEPSLDRWVPFDDGNEAFSPRRFPPGAVVDLQIEGRLVQLNEQIAPEDRDRKTPAVEDQGSDNPRLQSTPSDRNDPQVFILSSGDITPFELRVRPSIGAPGFSLAVEASGSVELIRDER